MSASDAFFEHLTGVVRVPNAAPEEWKKSDLAEFYRHPNDKRWGATLCRVLFHESLHLWQLLASGYLANLVAEEWSRLMHFEQEKDLLTQSSAMRSYRRSDGQPFSAEELAECLARYWDIHTRGPHSIVEDEAVVLPKDLAPTTHDPVTGGVAYTNLVYDYLMQHGPESSGYERPYRWLLEQTGGNSIFVALTFPILAHAAFGTPEPVSVFSEACERSWKSETVQYGLANKTSRNINFDWMNHWSVLREEGLGPVLKDRKLPAFTGGFDVIQRGSLKTHPIYSDYIARSQILQGRVKLFRAQFGAYPPREVAAVPLYASADLAFREPWAVFGLAGQPEYRELLGRALPPPRVVFSNFAWTSRWSIQARSSDTETEDFSSVLDALIKRVDRLRDAEYAQSVGLPLNGFEVGGSDGSEALA